MLFNNTMSHEEIIDNIINENNQDIISEEDDLDDLLDSCTDNIIDDLKSEKDELEDII